MVSGWWRNDSIHFIIVTTRHHKHQFIKTIPFIADLTTNTQEKISANKCRKNCFLCTTCTIIDITPSTTWVMYMKLCRNWKEFLLWHNKTWNQVAKVITLHLLDRLYSSDYINLLHIVCAQISRTYQSNLMVPISPLQQVLHFLNVFEEQKQLPKDKNKHTSQHIYI